MINLKNTISCLFLLVFNVASAQKTVEWSMGHLSFAWIETPKKIEAEAQKIVIQTAEYDIQCEKIRKDLISKNLNCETIRNMAKSLTAQSDLQTMPCKNFKNTNTEAIYLYSRNEENLTLMAMSSDPSDDKYYLFWFITTAFKTNKLEAEAIHLFSTLSKK